VGFGGWVEVSNISGRREAWDSPIYFSIFFPLLLLLSAILGYLAPDRPWRWGMCMAAGQALIIFALNPGGSLLPLGLIMFGILGGVIGIPAIFTAQIRIRADAREAAGG
jgi:hypothetical protein